MAGREPAPEELAAADVVADAVGGHWESRDGEGDPPGMHDFDVILPDGRCIALEVTSAIDGAVVALSDAAFGREGRQQRWPAPALTNDWIVTIPQRRVRVADMMSAMLPILEVFEEHGHADVDPHVNYAYVSPRSEMPAAVVEAARRMVELGVTRARVLAPRAEGDAEMFVTISGGFTGDPGAVNRLVAERAEPKREKLARAKADSASECHLFVWLDGTQPGAELAVAKMPPPPAPEIPSEVDVVWLTTPPLATPEKLWRARQSEGWEVLR
ncbi:MAG TPA: hypothetical protein VEF89_15165 [Solirubrobacteraceae bacterium]|nr:hypothetical protein [Solirubrobacteraceae bacterium]